jgi:hypothetical protein
MVFCPGRRRRAGTRSIGPLSAVSRSKPGPLGTAAGSRQVSPRWCGETRTPSLVHERLAICARGHRLIVDQTPRSHMTAVHPSEISMQQQATPKAETPHIAPEIIPPGADWPRSSRIWISHRPAPHDSHSDCAAGTRQHRPLGAAGRNSGSGWAGVAARSRPDRRCRSWRAHWRDLLQPLAASISAIAPRLQVGPERHLWEMGTQMLSSPEDRDLTEGSRQLRVA